VRGQTEDVCYRITLSYKSSPTLASHLDSSFAFHLTITTVVTLVYVSMNADGFELHLRYRFHISSCGNLETVLNYTNLRVFFVTRHQQPQ
jgi:hypothetical protein